MITVYENNSVCELLLGKQQKISFPYRWINFTVFSDVESGCLILNTLTGRLIFIPNYTAKQLKENPNLISECDELFEKWFLVSDNTDEAVLCDQLRDILQTMAKPNPVSSYTILTTTACNARCPYCFEKDLTPVFMGEEIA